MSNKKDISSVYSNISMHTIKAPNKNPDKTAVSGSVTKASRDGRGGKK